MCPTGLAVAMRWVVSEGGREGGGEGYTNKQQGDHYD